MVVALVGVGVPRLYPAPSQSDSKLQKLDSQQKALDNSRRLLGGKSTSHDAFYKKLSDSIAAEKKAVRAGRDAWVLNTSIVLVALATLIMGASLVLATRFRVLSNGLLLGGFFTMLYGAAWSFTQGESNTRYAIIGAALVVMLAVGYMRFVRTPKVGAIVPEPPESTPNEPTT